MTPEEANMSEVIQEKYLAQVRKVVAMFTDGSEVLDEPGNTFFSVVYMIISVIAGKTFLHLHLHLLSNNLVCIIHL